MKTKLLILSGIVLAFSSCSNDILTGGGEVNDPTTSGGTGLATASYTIGQASQARTRSVDTWTVTHSDDWMSNLNFEKPTEYTEVVNGVQLEGSGTYYVPATFTGTLSFKDNFNGKIYIDAELTGFSGNNLGNVSIYILKNGSWTLNGINTGNITIYNQGNLILGSWAWQNQNIKTVYNGGYVKIGKSGENPGFADGVSLYSNGTGIVDIEGESIDLKLACDIHGTMNVKGNLKIQNGKTQYICGLEIEGTLDVTQGNLQTSYIKADEIKFDGAKIWLLPEAHIVANKISMPNSASAIVGYEDSYALVETGEFYLRNHNNFQDTFSDNISFKVNGSIDIQERLVRENGQVDDVPTKYSTVEEYLTSQNGQAVADRFNGEELSGNPECGDSYGTPEVDPTPEEPKGPQLIPVISVESPEEGTHDHNSDKGEKGKKRYLSATCIDFDEDTETFYVSYHMRGYNWGDDQYEKKVKGDMSDVEGCIETWKFAESEGQTILKLGTYMWTYEFDFNHLIIDGSDIVTVGHKEDKGAIIAKLPNSFADFNPSYEEGELWTSNDLEYKYLTTEKKLYGDVYNENQGTTTEQWIGYEDAGDGNCVIRVDDKYFVATYAGYGKINAADFSRVQDEEGNVAFVSTPYSAKHIINKGNDIAVLYLNDTPEGKNVAASDKSTATLATISEDAFPFNASEKTLDSFVQPVDGKNVIAWNEAKQEMYVCMGKGGLNINDQIYTFGEDNQEPVNGVAFDEKYIYIASGSHLRALDITTKEEVASYSIPNMSANYIKLAKNSADGETYIVVAFGQEGVRVFRLEE